MCSLNNKIKVPLSKYNSAATCSFKTKCVDSSPFKSYTNGTASRTKFNAGWSKIRPNDISCKDPAKCAKLCGCCNVAAGEAPFWRSYLADSSKIQYTKASFFQKHCHANTTLVEGYDQEKVEGKYFFVCTLYLSPMRALPQFKSSVAADKLEKGIEYFSLVISI